MTKDRSYTTAIHILSALAFQDPTAVTSEELARGLQTNAGLVRRVLGKLSQAGLVDSIKGSRGGNRLAKSPEKINLKMIYLAVKNGPLFHSFEKEPFKPCPVSCQIGGILENVYGDLEQGLLKNMEKVKLKKIMTQLN